MPNKQIPLPPYVECPNPSHRKQLHRAEEMQLQHPLETCTPSSISPALRGPHCAVLSTPFGPLVLLDSMLGYIDTSLPNSVLSIWAYFSGNRAGSN